MTRRVFIKKTILKFNWGVKTNGPSIRTAEQALSPEDLLNERLSNDGPACSNSLDHLTRLLSSPNPPMDGKPHEDLSGRSFLEKVKTAAILIF